MRRWRSMLQAAAGSAMIGAAVLASGCAHAPRREVSVPAAELRCEDAAGPVVRRARIQPLDELRLAISTPLSWVLSGAGWVADGAIIGGAGIGAGVFVCLPIIALESAAHGNGNASADCVTRVAGAVWEDGPTVGVGRGVYRATHTWRCPDHVQLAREVRAVARCYAARGGPGDAELARFHLLQLRAVREIWACLPEGERREIDAALGALEGPY